MKEMEHIISVLKCAGVPVSDFVPDGKLHQTEDFQFYIGYRNFNSKTGAPFFTLLYGQFDDPQDYCSDDDLDAADRTLVKKRLKQARNVLARHIPEEKKEDIPVRKELMSLTALGFKEKEFFFTSTHNRQIVSISSFKHSDLLSLLPLEYWEANFPGSNQTTVNWNQAISVLMDQARRCGIFQSRHIRGAGVWSDEKRIVVNMGNHLLVDGKRVELGDLESKFFYTLGTALPELHEQPLSSEECEPLLRACSTFRWIKPDYSFLMAGALVVSRICGALPIRPHVWLTGGSQTGKSTLLERLIHPILGQPVLNVFGNTSEAGVRQSLRADAIPVMFDEFETTGLQSAERVNSIVEFLRTAWSESSAYIVKGGATGNATAYQARCCALVSSIRTRLTNDADRSRFAILELAPHGSDADHWKELSGYLDCIDIEYGNRLFARTIQMVPVLLKNFKQLKSALASRVSQRFGDQYGMLLAGYSILLQDEAITADQAIQIVDCVTLMDEREEAKVVDHDECLQRLFFRKIRFERQSCMVEMTVQEMISNSGDQTVKDALLRLGVKVDWETLSIPSSHPELESQVFAGTRWSLSWNNSLSRLEGAKKSGQLWLNGKNIRCVVLSRKTLGV